MFLSTGGVTLLRAAAKNNDRVLVVCDPSDYNAVIEEIKKSPTKEAPIDFRYKSSFLIFSIHPKLVSEQHYCRLSVNCSLREISWENQKFH